jgi:hypothetical protein
MHMRYAWMPDLLLLGANCKKAGENTLAFAGSTPTKMMLKKAQTEGGPLLAVMKPLDQRETPGALDRAIALLEGQLSQQPPSVDLLVLLTQAHSRCLEVLDVKKMGDLASHQLHWTKGRSSAQDTLRLEPNNRGRV